MSNLVFITTEISRLQTQVIRQRGEILQLRQRGLPSANAEALLQRMLDSFAGICRRRDRLEADAQMEVRPSMPGVLRGVLQ